jgi:hypothetical protein
MNTINYLVRTFTWLGANTVLHNYVHSHEELYLTACFISPVCINTLCRQKRIASVLGLAYVTVQEVITIWPDIEYHPFLFACIFDYIDIYIVLYG